ncbi:putative proteophosphoglycan 5, related protein [Toxoplasma gondii RUB]|uniref:Putative proteophosphoglycan 5, related protein n=1 Tax=Toxoplasma gondii RUB TaxID=935652 RepID=A0A086M8W9_TOXGO|nr:putative proteophosphoglycan 5, related protein [Toxoplasma gondii RUB]
MIVDPQAAIPSGEGYAQGLVGETVCAGSRRGEEEFVDAEDGQSRLDSVGTDCSAVPIEQNYFGLRADESGVQMLQYLLHKEAEKVWILNAKLEKEGRSLDGLRRQSNILRDEYHRLQKEYKAMTDLYLTKEELCRKKEAKVKELLEENERLRKIVHQGQIEVETFKIVGDQLVDNFEEKIIGIMTECSSVASILAKKWTTKDLRAAFERKSVGDFALAHVCLLHCRSDETADDNVERGAKPETEVNFQNPDAGEQDQPHSLGHGKLPSTSAQEGQSVCEPAFGGGSASDKEEETPAIQCPAGESHKLSKGTQLVPSFVSVERQLANIPGQTGAKVRGLSERRASLPPPCVNGYRKQPTGIRNTIHTGSLTAGSLSAIGRKRLEGIQNNSRMSLDNLAASQGTCRSIRIAALNSTSVALKNRPAWGRSPVRRVISENFSAPLTGRHTDRQSGPPATTRLAGEKKCLAGSKTFSTTSEANLSVQTKDEFQGSAARTPQNRTRGPGCALTNSVRPRGSEAASATGDKVAYIECEKSLKSFETCIAKGQAVSGSVTDLKNVRSETANEPPRGHTRVTIGDRGRGSLSHRGRKPSDGAGGCATARSASRVTARSLVRSVNKVLSIEKSTSSETIRKQTSSPSNAPEKNTPSAGTSAQCMEKAAIRTAPMVCAKTGSALGYNVHAISRSQAPPEHHDVPTCRKSVGRSSETHIALADACRRPTPHSPSTSFGSGPLPPSQSSASDANQGGVNKLFYGTQSKGDTTRSPVETVVSNASVGSVNSQIAPLAQTGAKSDSVGRKTASKLPPVQPSPQPFSHASRISFDPRPLKVGGHVNIILKPFAAKASHCSDAVAFSEPEQPESGGKTSGNTSGEKTCSSAAESHLPLLTSECLRPVNGTAIEENDIRRPTESQQGVALQATELLRSFHQPSEDVLDCSNDPTRLRLPPPQSKVTVSGEVPSFRPNVGLEGTDTDRVNLKSCPQEETETGDRLSERDGDTSKEFPKCATEGRLPSRTVQRTAHAEKPKKIPLEDLTTWTENNGVAAVASVAPEHRPVDGVATAKTQSRQAGISRLRTPEGTPSVEDNTGLGAYLSVAPHASAHTNLETESRDQIADESRVKTGNPLFRNTNATAAADLPTASHPMNCSTTSETQQSSKSAQGASDISGATTLNNSPQLGPHPRPVSAFGVSASVPAGFAEAGGRPDLSVDTREIPTNAIANNNIVKGTAALPSPVGTVLRGSTGLMQVRRVAMGGPAVAGGERASLPVFCPSSLAHNPANNTQLSWSSGANVNCPPAPRPVYTRFTVSGPDAGTRVFAKQTMVTQSRPGDVKEGAASHPSAASLGVSSDVRRSVQTNCNMPVNQLQPPIRVGGNETSVHPLLPPQMSAGGERPRMPSQTFTFTTKPGNGAPQEGWIRITGRPEGQGKQGYHPSGFGQYQARPHAFHDQPSQVPGIQQQTCTQMPNQSVSPVQMHYAMPRAPGNSVTPQGYALPQQPQHFTFIPHQMRSQDSAGQWSPVHMQLFQRTSWHPMQCPQPACYDKRFPVLTQVRGQYVQTTVPSHQGLLGPPAGLN